MQIQRDTTHLSYIDPQKLEEAYWAVPVVSEEDLRSTTELLEAFAVFLANSWMRLADMVKERQRQESEIELLSKEFAYLVLDGTPSDLRSVRDLITRLALSTCPNRVLLIRPNSEEETGISPGSFDIAWTTAIQAIWETCGGIGNLVVANLHKKGACVFFDDRIGYNESAGDYHAFNLAKALLDAAAQRTSILIRAGIGSARPEWALLRESFEEASLALTGSQERICTFRPQQESLAELYAIAEELLHVIQERGFQRARHLLRHLTSQTNRTLREQAMAQRVLLSSIYDNLVFAVEEAGGDPDTLHLLRADFQSALDAASGPANIQDAFLSSATSIIAEFQQAYVGRRKRVIERAITMIRREVAAGLSDHPLSISKVAHHLGISVSHLSRTFRQKTGETFDRFTMRERVELAKRLLLEPRLNIVDVAERCGFSDASYFARVFRKIAGCSPRDFAEDPLRMSSHEPRKDCVSPTPDPVS